MTLEELKKHKKILLVGHGVEGKATEAYLKKHIPTVEIGIADKKNGEDYLQNQSDYDLAIRSPGVIPELIKIPYTTAANIFFSNAKGKIIGVTGTKGKSTTSSLIYEILKTAGKDVYLGGNIGIPMLDFMDELSNDSLSVLELSSFHLLDLKKSPHIAVMLMVVPEHLDYHRDIYSYIEAKRNILVFQSPSDFAIVNRDYPVSNESDILTLGKIYRVSREQDVDQGCFVKDGNILLKMDGHNEAILPIKEVALKGGHNLENVCAAVIASLCAGASMESIIPVLKSFKGLYYRLEFIGEKNGIRFYNDSLATIPEATIAALEALGADVTTLIAGGHDRGIEYTELGEHIAKTKVKTLILFSGTGEKIWDAVIKATPASVRPEKFEVKSMEEAVKIADEKTENGKICLMSPGSASFGTFKDYRDRGDQFKKEVSLL